MAENHLPESSAAKTIYLSVDRKEQVIDVSTIMYAVVTDKLCTIYFTHSQPVRVFLTLSALMAMLPKNEFLQISRSTMVNLEHVKNISNDAVILTDSTRLSYTLKKKSAILYAFQQNLSSRARAHNAIAWNLDFSRDYRCLDRCPIPFFLLEISTPSPQSPPQFIVRYANDAMASMSHTPLPHLINRAFAPSPMYDLDELNNFLTQVAFGGGMMEWHEKHLSTNTPLHVICYQPYYGFCACFILATSLKALLRSAPEY